MKLEFTTVLNKKPTYFVEKIWSGLFDELFDKNNPEETSLVFDNYGDFFSEYRLKYKDPNQTVFNDEIENIFPKIHTIRRKEFSVEEDFLPVIIHWTNFKY